MKYVHHLIVGIWKFGSRKREGKMEMESQHENTIVKVNFNKDLL